MKFSADQARPLSMGSRTLHTNDRYPSAMPNPGYSDDLYSFDPVSMNWARLASTAVPRPSIRSRHGFTSVGDKLYVHGGWNGSGNARGVRGV